jgi:hypothetical protein
MLEFIEHHGIDTLGQQSSNDLQGSLFLGSSRSRCLPQRSQNQERPTGDLQEDDPEVHLIRNGTITISRCRKCSRCGV